MAALAASLVLATSSACATAAPVTTPTTRGTGSVTGDWDGVGAFTHAVLAQDTAAAARYVSADSPASRYLAYSDDLTAAASGEVTPGSSNWTVKVDKHLGEVTMSLVDGTSLTWTDWRFDDAGKILQWSTPIVGALEDRLVTARPAASAGEATVKVSSGLVNDSRLSLVLAVTAGPGGVTPDCAATFVPTGGALPNAAPAADCTAPKTIAAGTSGKVALQWQSSTRTGTVTYTVRDAAGAALGTVNLTIG